MKKRLLRTAAIAGLLVTGSGCAVVGEAGGAVGQLLNLAIYVAVIVLPFALAYYLWSDD